MIYAQFNATRMCTSFLSIQTNAYFIMYSSFLDPYYLWSDQSCPESAWKEDFSPYIFPFVADQTRRDMKFIKIPCNFQLRWKTMLSRKYKANILILNRGWYFKKVFSIKWAQSGMFFNSLYRKHIFSCKPKDY